MILILLLFISLLLLYTTSQTGRANARKAAPEAARNAAPEAAAKAARSAWWKAAAKATPKTVKLSTRESGALIICGRGLLLRGVSNDGRVDRLGSCLDVGVVGSLLWLVDTGLSYSSVDGWELRVASGCACSLLPCCLSLLSSGFPPGSNSVSYAGSGVLPDGTGDSSDGTGDSSDGTGNSSDDSGDSSDDTRNRDASDDTGSRDSSDGTSNRNWCDGSSWDWCDGSGWGLPSYHDCWPLSDGDSRDLPSYHTSRWGRGCDDSCWVISFSGRGRVIPSDGSCWALRSGDWDQLRPSGG
ncbi:hypothetical protein CDD80_5901 [Ophiocordyceps camponoti-rufipedis]|uniref:Uncharacterized protein n=1 Tax=Ophiocordyceps camponoti-rufipedis TaxID=2004952 RepID=A0A2C5YSI3_9HYPO|nr:hypothetical protein CDD80_5901 [Ophiocordyceps camponoti-rufipedis]